MKHLSIRLISVALLLMLTSLLVFAQWTDGQNATFVIGQADFTSSGSGATATTLDTPKDVAIDVDHGKVYVVDHFNNRVLRYVYPITGNQPAAEFVFGQADFLSNGSGTTQNTLNHPMGVTVDSTGRLWVAEYGNNRVVWFNSAHTIAANQPNADGVLGQPNFTSNGGATTQSGMNRPDGMAVDATGTLFVTEHGNNRVLRFDNAAGKANGANADGVLGQSDFISSGNATTQNGMNSPRGVALFGTTLFVADRSNSRVLRFDNAASKANGANADGVLGQPDFTSSANATTQSGMGRCARVVVDGCGRLYVSDAFNNDRVLIYDDAVSKANGGPADNVLGQPDFTSSGGATAQNRFNMDSSGAGLAVDVINNRFLAADDNNNRVMHFQASETLACASIIVEKQTFPDGSTQAFEFQPSYGANFFLADGQTNNSGYLVPGAYSVAEVNVPAGWDLTSATCDDGSDPSNIGLDPGETVTCTFTNTYPPIPIGGIIVPVNRFELLALRLGSGQAPWLGLAALVSLAALAVAVVRRRRGG